MLLLGSLSVAARKSTVIWWTPYATPFYEPWSSWVPKAFMEENPDIDLKVVPLSWGDLTSKLLPSIAGGNPPDTFQWMSWVGELAVKGAVLPIDKLVASDPNLNPKDWFPVIWAATTYRGATYGLPGETDAFVFYWNKNLFSKAGLDPEKPPRTWGEVDDYAEKLTQKGPDGKYKVIGFIPWVGGRDVIHYGWQNGGEFVDPTTGDITADAPKNVEALEWEVSYAKKYDITQIKSFEQQGQAIASDLFALDNLAMASMGSWLWSQHDQYGPNVVYGMGLLPTPKEGVQPYVITSPSVLFIPLGSKNPEAAYKFMSWYVRNAVLRWALQVGDLVTRPDLVNLPELKGNWKQAASYEALKYSKPWPRTPVMSLLDNELNYARDEAIYGKKTAKEALETAQARVQAEWLKIRKKFTGQ